MPADSLWANPMLSSMMKDSNLLAGFININNVNSGNRELEQEILADVAGYGRQLGRIMEVMKILIDKKVLKGLNDRESIAVQDLRDLIERIDEKKYRTSPTSITPQNVDQAIKALRRLAPEERGKVLAEISKEFPNENGS